MLWWLSRYAEAAEKLDALAAPGMGISVLLVRPGGQCLLLQGES